MINRWFFLSVFFFIAMLAAWIINDRQLELNYQLCSLISLAVNDLLKKK